MLCGTVCFHVTHVAQIRGTSAIRHYGTFSGGVLALGDKVELHVDRETRLLNSRYVYL